MVGIVTKRFLKLSILSVLKKFMKNEHLKEAKFAGKHKNKSKAKAIFAIVIKISLSKILSL